MKIAGHARKDAKKVRTSLGAMRSRQILLGATGNESDLAL